MGRFDYFCADLKCPRCGFLTRGHTGMTCYLRPDPQSEDFYVGDQIEVSAPEDVNYTVLRPHTPGGTIRLVESWACAGCGYWPNWGEVTIVEGVIRSIEVATLSPELFERVNYITEEAESAMQEASGRSYRELQGRSRWPAPATPESRVLARLTGLTDEDAAALLGVDDDQLSDEERARLRAARADLRAGRTLSEPQLDALRLLAAHLP